jgi:hypothetical protein
MTSTMSGAASDYFIDEFGSSDSADQFVALR